MLQATGWIDDRWFTADASERGTAVHRLTLDYDLGALDPRQCLSLYKPWLLGYVTAIAPMAPEFLHLEEGFMHPTFRFGGRPDRVGFFYGCAGVLEIKTGAYMKSHLIQTALQAILVAPVLRLPPESLVRYCAYAKGNGRFKIEEFIDVGDFLEARKVIAETCG
jgi:hypothetical protein